MFNKYPYTDFHELNLDWVISEVQKINESIDSLIDINTIKYADPMDWDVTKQYEKNTVVINGYNTYLSKLPVPAGIQIDNTEYWLLIGNFNIALREVNERVDNVEVSIAETDARVDDIDTDIVGLKEKDVHIENMIAGTWSSTITYTAGTYVTYLDSMYKCKLQNIATVPTNATYWENVKVGSELKLLNEKLISMKSDTYNNQLIVLGKGYANRAYGSFYMPSADDYTFTLNQVLVWNGSASSDVTSNYILEPRKFAVNLVGDANTTTHVGQTVWVTFTVSKN